jgi:hypothetical protein
LHCCMLLRMCLSFRTFFLVHFSSHALTFIVILKLRLQQIHCVGTILLFVHFVEDQIEHVIVC